MNTEGVAPSRRQFIAGAVVAGVGAIGAAHADDSPPQPLLLDDRSIYLNTGSLGPPPRVVVDAMIDAIRRIEADPMSAYDVEAGRADEVRQKLADMLRCDAGDIALLANTTEAMNLIAQGCELQRGDRVLSTDHEHEGGSACWRYLADRRGIVLDRVALPLVPKDADQIVEIFERVLTDQTRVISVSHVTYTSGLRLPISELAKLARARDVLLVVDGAQALGAIDVNLSELHADAYAASGHKWMLGPTGTGMLYLSRAAAGRIQPMPLAQGPRVYTGAVGLRNLPAMIGLGAAIDWTEQTHGRERFARMMHLRNRAYESLNQLNHKLLSPPPGSPFASPILTLAAQDAPKLVEHLRSRHQIVTRAVQHADVSGVRVSFSVINDQSHVDRLIAALRSAR